jgi:hypothetical protein
MSSARTKVYFTVDVECAEERLFGERLQPAMGYDLRMWGRLDNQRELLGIDLIMRELEACNFRGTFFVEALGSHHFGQAGLTEVCRALHGRGHDVQLHLHPIQRNAEWHTRGDKPANDDIASYPVDQQVRLLREGLDILEQCGIPRSTLRAYRAGNFGASNDTWRAMKEAGLTLSSNYNPCYFSKNCKMRTTSPEAGVFETEVPGVWELPITNFKEPRGGFRHLQITAVSLDEMKEALWQSRRLGVGEVTFVTHSFEFFFLDSIPSRRGHKNVINARRLRGLFEFLRDNPDDFEVETVGALAGRLAEQAPRVGNGAAAGRAAGPAYPRMPARHHVMRLAEQAVKRLAARVPI